MYLKELSTEEKARAYDEALKRAKSKIKNDKDHVLYEDDVIEIFPELKESEDERMLSASTCRCQVSRSIRTRRFQRVRNPSTKGTTGSSKLNLRDCNAVSLGRRRGQTTGTRPDSVWQRCPVTLPTSARTTPTRCRATTLTTTMS